MRLWTEPRAPGPLVVNNGIGRLHFPQDFRPSDGLFHVVFNAMSNACIVTCYVPN
jgi:hypothetical protein